jgi:hypothetical protein
MSGTASRQAEAGSSSRPAASAGSTSDGGDNFGGQRARGAQGAGRGGMAGVRGAREDIGASAGFRVLAENRKAIQNP